MPRLVFKTGPKDTPYEGGIFYIDILLGEVRTAAILPKIRNLAGREIPYFTL